MRKCYVLFGWTPENGSYVSGIYTSRRKAEDALNMLQNAKHKVEKLYRIETMILR